MNEDNKTTPIPENEIIKTLGYAIHENCKKYAIDHMVDNDFILFTDANNITTKDIKMCKDNDGDLYTIKNSSSEKFEDFYQLKLENIIQKFLKE